VLYFTYWFPTYHHARASSDARRFTLAVSGSRPQRTLIAYVDGPNEGPAEMVIIGGYR
jgi:hypothetical protein